MLDFVLKDPKNMYSYQSRKRMHVYASCGYQYEMRDAGEGLHQRIDELVGSVCLGE